MQDADLLCSVNIQTLGISANNWVRRNCAWGVACKRCSSLIGDVHARNLTKVQSLICGLLRITPLLATLLLLPVQVVTWEISVLGDVWYPSEPWRYAKHCQTKSNSIFQNNHIFIYVEWNIRWSQELSKRAALVSEALNVGPWAFNASRSSDARGFDRSSWASRRSRRFWATRIGATPWECYEMHRSSRGEGILKKESDIFF